MATNPFTCFGPCRVEPIDRYTIFPSLSIALVRTEVIKPLPLEPGERFRQKALFGLALTAKLAGLSQPSHNLRNCGLRR